jgi:hypothetical protein
MSCPPGTVLNPRTYRCISAEGRTAKALIREGAVAPAPAPAYNPWMGAYYQRPAEPPRHIRARLTVRRPRARVGGGAFGDIIRLEGVGRREAAAVAQQPHHECDAGTVRNPRTGRCIKITGRTYKQLHHKPVTAPAPAPEPALVLAPPPTAHRRALSEGRPVPPTGVPAVAPIGDRTTTLQWIAGNCANDTDPVARTAFATQPTVEDIIRLHDNTCVAAPGLHRHVAAEHKVGRVAVIPGNRRGTPMTIEDFTALRAAMRRRDPAYKVPARRHEPPPPTWQLYVASDRRSGPQFASVMYVDITKARSTAYGVEYPADAIRVDMGYIPAVTPVGAICTIQTIVDLLDRLAKENRLLTSAAGGWRPIAGFPFTKDHWSMDTANRLNRLCRDLAKALATPL